MSNAHVSTYCIPPQAADKQALSMGERAYLSSQSFGAIRANEWIRGRMAMRQSLNEQMRLDVPNIDILGNPDGSPIVHGTNVALSLSHDDSYFAVVVTDEDRVNVGVDLCLRSHEERVNSILGHYGILSPAISPTLQWCAIEAVLKLRRLPATFMMNRSISVVKESEMFMVCGIGMPVPVALKQTPQFSLAWVEEHC